LTVVCRTNHTRILLSVPYAYESNYGAEFIGPCV